MKEKTVITILLIILFIAMATLPIAFAYFMATDYKIYEKEESNKSINNYTEKIPLYYNIDDNCTIYTRNKSGDFEVIEIKWRKDYYVLVYLHLSYSH